jgi:hypothetical protein
MANEKRTVTIDSINSNDKFVNIKGTDGIEYGISKDKNPKLYEEAKTKNSGDSITGECFQWKDKWYLSEVKESKSGGGNKTFTPKDKGFEAGIAAANAVAQLYSLNKDVTDDQIKNRFKLFHELIMGTKTA